MLRDGDKLIFKSEKEIKDYLSSKANSNCNTCYGRGYEGYKEDKITGHKTFIPCHRSNCVNKGAEDILVLVI